MSIFLTGFSMTGKSAVARIVARRLGWGVVDMDAEIEKGAGKPIPQIFAQDGEVPFRTLESQILEGACRRKRQVIATGGGAIVKEENRKSMFRSGLVVLLEAQPDTIYQRLLKDDPQSRPLLVDPDPLRKIQELKARRQALYNLAHTTIATDNLSREQVADEVIRRWGFWELQPSVLVHTSSRDYPIYVGWGLLEGLGLLMRRAGLRGRGIITSDEQVHPLYGPEVEKSLKEAGLESLSFAVPPGENSKALETVSPIYDFLVENRIERGDNIIALGGGMVGDLVGFVAATFLRGLPLVQVPTSLVAMVDASIGGKVAINHPQGKNLIGAFYQPRLVLADTRCLTSLPPRELTSGWAEVIKYGFTLDPHLLPILEQNVEVLRALDPTLTPQVIARSARVKAEVVSQDEKEETGRRTILNYGHTIAHGLEAATGYGHFLHGEAVAIGMMGAALLSQHLGLLAERAVARHQQLLQAYGLPTSCPGVEPEAVLQAMELDKKVRQGEVRWVLLKEEGQVVIGHPVPQEEVRAVLRELTP